MIQFDEKSHTYTLDGVELPSVTHICRFLAYDYKSSRPWLAAEAARRGTVVHEACALIDYGEIPEENPEIAGYLKAYRRFLADYRPDWKLIEYPMGNLELGYAGTLDRYGSIYRGDCTRFCILDIKTGQLHEPSLSVQLTAYKWLLPPWEPCNYLYALQLRKDGTYLLAGVPSNGELLEACITLHNATERKKRA